MPSIITRAKAKQFMTLRIPMYNSREFIDVHDGSYISNIDAAEFKKLLTESNGPRSVPNVDESLPKVNIKLRYKQIPKVNC